MTPKGPSLFSLACHHTTPVGKGNGGTVLKAVYLPTMKLVALKSVPIYSAQRRQQMVQVSRVVFDELAGERLKRGHVRLTCRHLFDYNLGAIDAVLQLGRH